MLTLDLGISCSQKWILEQARLKRFIQGDGAGASINFNLQATKLSIKLASQRIGFHLRGRDAVDTVIGPGCIQDARGHKTDNQENKPTRNG